MPKDTFSAAYEEVKLIWQERHIWRKEWTVLPGIAWMHEDSLETVLRDALGDDCVDNYPEAQNAIKEDKQRENDAIRAGIAEAMERDRTHPNPTWAAVKKAAEEERSNPKPKAAKAAKASNVLDKESEKTITLAAQAQKPSEVVKLKPIEKPKPVEKQKPKPKPKQAERIRKEPEVQLRRSPRILELEQREGVKNYRFN